MSNAISKRLAKFYLKKGEYTRASIIGILNSFTIILLIIVISFIVILSNSNIPNIYSLIPGIPLVIIAFFYKKILLMDINFYSFIILDYLDKKNRRIPDFLFDNLHSEIESYKINLDKSDLNVFDLYLYYLKYFIKNKFHDNELDRTSTSNFLKDSLDAFNSKNTDSLSIIITQDYNNLKNSENKNVLKDSINSIIKFKINFNKDILETLRKIHDKLNKQTPNKIRKFIKFVFNNPIKCILFIFVILLVLFVVLSLLGKDVSRILPLFEPINNFIKSFYCK